jgi:hypothetical protein
MLTWFSKFFSAPTSKPAPIVVETPTDMPALQWRADSAFPIPRGQAFRRALQAQSVANEKDYWRALFQDWFVALGQELKLHSDYAPNGFSSAWREDFLLLSPLDERRTELLARFCERSARRICRALPELAQKSHDGALPIIVFPDAEIYERYAAHLYRDEAGIASAGMFVLAADDDELHVSSSLAGFGHFIVLADEIEHAEPTLVHELTHALLSHLDLPLWIDEGIATMMEGSMAHAATDPAFVINRRADLLRRHRLFWTAQTKPSFWDGSAFRDGAASELAYDMAFRIVFELARDMPSFSAFAKAANPEDGGAAAAAEIYGLPIEALLDAHLQM